jgi:hypothetical protein
MLSAVQSAKHSRLLRKWTRKYAAFEPLSATNATH